MPQHYPSPTQSSHWAALEQAAETLDTLSLPQLIKDSAHPFTHDFVTCGPITLDASRHLITKPIWNHLKGLAEDQKLSEFRDKMFAGDKINIFEKRSVLHTALRKPRQSEIKVDGHNVMPDVYDVLDRMELFCKSIHDKNTITDIVNIGIGGSYLGPEMVSHALTPYHIKGINAHFVANIDGHDLQATLEKCKPQSTLFLIASKTFTTQETMTNAHSAKQWIVNHLGEQAVIHHFAALSTNMDAAKTFGIKQENVFPFWDWVGGRFSLWSAIGLPIALTIGFENFRALLDGAAKMDDHFVNAPFDQNIPVILALVGLWYRTFCNMPALAILPYDQRLDRLPAYLQQLDMESNGKSVDRNNKPFSYKSGPILFGEPGTNGQHAFYQLIHQGQTIIPCEFIGIVKNHHEYDHHHRILNAHLLAQAKALAEGRNLEDAGGNPQKVFKGNRPCSLIMLDCLTPDALGQLIALYEHKIFVQGLVWNINSFDQWGVELGKQIASHILEHFDNPQDSDLDHMTCKLLGILT